MGDAAVSVLCKCAANARPRTLYAVGVFINLGRRCNVVCALLSASRVVKLPGRGDIAISCTGNRVSTGSFYAVAADGHTLSAGSIPNPDLHTGSLSRTHASSNPVAAAADPAAAATAASSATDG